LKYRLIVSDISIGERIEYAEWVRNAYANQEHANEAEKCNRSATSKVALCPYEISGPVMDNFPIFKESYAGSHQEKPEEKFQKEVHSKELQDTSSKLQEVESRKWREVSNCKLQGVEKGGNYVRSSTVHQLSIHPSGI
jgi:predicted ATPase with chaperone activity